MQMNNSPDNHGSALHVALTNGIETAYAADGDGPPLILIHGAEADHGMFGALSEHLRTRFRVIAYDQRDSGLTVNPPEPYTLSDLADDAAALIKVLGYRKVHVFGTSLGGHIAQLLAARHPEKIDKLVLGSTWRAGQPLREINPDAAASLTVFRANPALHAPGIAAFFFPAAHIAAHPEVIAMFRGSQRDGGQKARRAALLAAQVPVDYPAITSPTLLLAGTEDRLVPCQSTFDLVEHIAHATKIGIAGLGHIGVLQAPREVAGHLATFLLAAPVAANGKESP